MTVSGMSTPARSAPGELVLEHRASLPHPPSINRTYRSTRDGSHWYKSERATTRANLVAGQAAFDGPSTVALAGRTARLCYGGVPAPLSLAVL
jgi:hypothetical protein